MDIEAILGAAHQRLKELRKQLGMLDRLKEEEQKLVRLLKGEKSAPAPARRGPRAKRGGRPARTEGTSILAVATRVLKRYAGTAGMTVKEILDRMRKSNPGRFNSDNASGALSSSLVQAMKSKKPKVKVIAKGGPGKPAKYGAASFVPPGPKAKVNGSGSPAKAGGASKLGLATDVLKRHAGTAGMTIKEVLERLRKSAPGSFNGKDAKALLSRAFGQSMRGKSPRVKVVVKGGPGKPAKYGAV